MTKKRFGVHKLIRDKSIERMEKRNISCTFRILNTQEYHAELKRKLEEEAAEVVAATTRDEILDELADVLEVISALAIEQGSSLEKIEEIRETRYAERGGFEKRLYGESIEMAADHPDVKNFQGQPHKYPEE